MVPPGGKPNPELVEQLRRGLQIMALRALGNPEDAEEAVQETLVRALEALRDGRPRDPDKLGAFVRGIARHVISDAHRARRRKVSLESLPEVERGTRHDNPLSSLITQEERGHLSQALDQLSSTDRDILHLSFFEGLSPTEIAERFAEPAPRIRKRKSRALRRLREAFARGVTTCHESRSSPTEK